MAGFLDGDATRALEAAVRAVETASSVELVIAVRRRSALYLHAHVIAGAVAMAAALAYMLYGDHAFSLLSILVDPFVVGIGVGAATELFPAYLRTCTPRNWRLATVHHGARAAFVERGVHHTRERTGILVYVSLLERAAALVVDAGVAAVWSAEDRARAEAAISAATAAGGAATAAAIAALAPTLAAVLPCPPDDINELPDALDVPPRRRWTR